MAIDQAAQGVALDTLFPSTRRTGNRGARVTACVTDWRAVQPGDAFVAMDDGEHDGHNDATRAIARGASAVVCEQQVPVFHRPVYVVPDSRVALGQLCQALVGDPSRDLPTIGVTGTQGKTTTVALIQSILDRSGHRCGVMGGMGCYDGMSHGRPLDDVPSPVEIAAKMAAMNASACTHAVAEITSQSLSRAAWAGVELDVVCVTNVSQAHVDTHNSVQNYREAKRRVLDHLSPEGFAVLNADDPVCTRWLSEHFGPALTYGMGPNAEVRAELYERHANEQFFVITAGSESAAVRTAIVGEHHVYNCLAAATVALALGIPLREIAVGIEALDRLPCRMERIDCGQGFPVYVDSASTLDGVRASLRTARQLAQGRVICVAGPEAVGPGPKGEAFRRVLWKMTDLAILSGGNQRHAEVSGDTHVELAGDRSEAIAMAVSVAESGDVVVITGSEPPASLAFGGGDCETELVRELLYARGRTELRVVA